MNDAIAEANQEMFDRLLVSIEAGMGMLQIFIAVCDADRQREQIISNYERDLVPNFQTYRVYLDRQEPSLRQAVDSANLPKEKAIAMVLGAEALGLSSPDDESLNKFFGYLQWTREAMRSLKLPIVLWVPSRIFKQLSKRAPDFWSWRNGVFQFQPEPSLAIVDLPRNIRFDEQPNSIFSAAQLEASLAKAISTSGADSRNVETLYSQLGNLYAQQVRSGKSIDRERELVLAEDYLNRAIALQIKSKQEEALAVSLNNLAELYYFQGRYHEAESLDIQLLTIREQKLGKNHPATAQSLNNLAELYRVMGKYTEAEPLYWRSFSIWEQQLGSNHPETAISLNNLGLLYESMGQYDKAEILYTKSYHIREHQLEKNYPNIAQSLNNLAGLYRATGRFEEAEPLYERSLDIDLKFYGAEHPEIATDLNNLAGLYELMRKYSKAESLRIRALEIAEKTLGSNHPLTQTIHNNLQILRQWLKSPVIDRD